jgi:WD40 repeat protein
MRFEGLPDEIAFCVSVSPDAKYLVAGGKPSAIAWDLQTGLALGKAFETNATLGLAFARTGSRISAALHGAGVISWVLPSVGDGTQLEDGRGTAEFADPGGPVFCVAGSPAGDQIIASGGDDQVIRLWGAGGKLIGEPLAGHSERITSLAFDASGRILASASKDGTVRLWNISDRGGSARGAPIYNEEGVIIYGIAFDPKSQRLAWGGRWKGNDNRLIVWDLDEGYVADLGGHLAAIRSVAFHPSDNFIVSGAADSKVKIWDLDREQERVELRDHDGVVTGVTFSADGRLLAASSLGSTPVLVWDMKSVFPPDFKLYQSERNPWLQLDKDAYDIRWHSSTDQLDGSGHFDLVNLPPGCHLGILQRSDFDPADPAKNAVLKNEALFGRFLYARNWNSALTMCRQLKADQSTRAAWAREALRQQLKAAAEENPASSAALLRDRLEAE